MSGDAGYTPGPWTVSAPWCGFSEIRGPAGELVFGLAAGGSDERQSEDTCDANARLIASAPALLEALERVVPILEGLDTLRHVNGAFPALDAARAALAAATGKQP